MIKANDLRPGITVELDGQPFEVSKYAHVKPGKGAAFVRVTLRNLFTGASHERTIRPEEKLERARLDERSGTFMYRAGDDYHFMDEETYEEFSLGADALGDKALWLKDGLSIQLSFYEGKLVSVTPPTFIEFAVAETEPGVRGDTATGATKNATLETGAVVTVPLFINEGDVVRVDTRTGAYVDRVKQG
jgi:elongation factor P